MSKFGKNKKSFLRKIFTFSSDTNNDGNPNQNNEDPLDAAERIFLITSTEEEFSKVFIDTMGQKYKYLVDKYYQVGQKRNRETQNREKQKGEISLINTIDENGLMKLNFNQEGTPNSFYISSIIESLFNTFGLCFFFILFFTSSFFAGIVSIAIWKIQAFQIVLSIFLFIAWKYSVKKVMRNYEVYSNQNLNIFIK